MNNPPLPPIYTDPNARLLASVVPPPPAPLKTRIWRRIEGFRGMNRRQALAGLWAFEAWHLWVVAGAAGAGMLVGVYRSELSSAARAIGDQAPHVQHQALRASEPSARNARLTPHASNVASSGRTPASGRGSDERVAPSQGSSTESVAPRGAVALPVADDPSAESKSGATESAELALQAAPDKPTVRRSARAAKQRALLRKKAAKARAQRRAAKASRRGKARVASVSSARSSRASRGAKVAAGSSSGSVSGSSDGSTRSSARRALASRARAIAFGRE